MNPIILAALTDVAVDLYRRMIDSPAPTEARKAGGDGEGPKTWQEAWEQIVAYAGEKNTIDEEQSELIVKIAEKVDAVAEEQKKISARFERHMVTANRVQIVSLLGGLCGIAALLIVILR